MAVKKPTTTEDLTTPADDLTASAKNTLPTREEMVARVEEHTAPEALAKPGEVKYVKVKSPGGDVTEVPESIVEPLLTSGYTKSK